MIGSSVFAGKGEVLHGLAAIEFAFDVSEISCP